MIITYLLTLLITFSGTTQKDEAFEKAVVSLIKQQKEVVDFKKTFEFYKANEWDSTLVYSYKVLTSAGHKDLINYALYFRAVSFNKKKLFKESLNAYLLISPKFPFYMDVKNGLGRLYLEQKKYDKALAYFLEVNKDSAIMGSKKSALLHNIGLCYFHQEKYKEAEGYLNKSVVLQEEEKDSLLLIPSYMDVANLYYVQYKDEMAIPYFEKAYQISLKAGNFDMKRKAAFNMAVVEENRKNLVKALKYRKEFEVWKDSLNDQNKIWSVAQIEKKHAVDEKQKEIRLLELENKAKIAERNGFIVSSGLFLILFASAIYFYTQKSKANKTILAQKEELDQLNATKDKLFSVVSHDLRSSVNALQQSNSKFLKHIANNDYESLQAAANKNVAIANSTYNLLENLLHWATLQTEQLYFDIESVDLYSIMQQIEYDYKPLLENKQLRFENNIPKASFILADLDSLKIIIRNLLDNAIKFSLENGLISVYLNPPTNAFQYLVIEDTGIGMDEETKQTLLKGGKLLTKKKNQKGIGTGLGLQLCKTMILKNNGSLDIESIEEKGTKMIVGIPKFQENG